MKQIEEISEAVLSDTDPDAVYIKEKVDRKLAAIMGDEVVPWEERYAVSLGPARNREQRRAEKKRKKGRR